MSYNNYREYQALLKEVKESDFLEKAKEISKEYKKRKEVKK